MDDLIAKVRQVRWRMTLQEWLNLCIRALAYAVGCALVWLILTRLFPFLGDPQWPIVALVGLGIVAATAWLLTHRFSLVDAALEADRRLGLKERVTSSLELQGRTSPMIEEVHRDARNQISRLNLQKDFAYRMPPKIRTTGAMVVGLLLVTGLMPQFDLLKYNEKKAKALAELKARQISAEKIRQVAQPLTAKEYLASEDLKEMASDVERIAEKLEGNEINEKQAFAKLDSLADRMLEKRQTMAEESPIPKLAGDSSKLGPTKEMAEQIQEGKFGEAANKLKDLREKLASKETSSKEAEDIKKDLEELSKMLAGDKTELGKSLSEALQKASQKLDMSQLGEALSALEQAEMSLADMESALQQLENLENALAKISKWQVDEFGSLSQCKACSAGICDASGNCMGCGKACIGGRWLAGEGRRGGGGMGGRGTGRGGMTGELPEVNAGFSPSILKGEMTQGKVLAGIIQKTAPGEERPESTLEFSSEALVEVRQEAEQALTKEEIPPGAKEYVRQYFGALDQK